MVFDKNQFEDILERDYFSSSPRLPKKVEVPQPIVEEVEDVTEEVETSEIIAESGTEILIAEDNNDLEDSEDDDFQEIFIENNTPVIEEKNDEEDDNNDEALESETLEETPQTQSELESTPIVSTMTLKGKIEAVLFLTNLPLAIAEIAEKLNTTRDEVELALLELVDDYVYRQDSALEIDDTDGYILQIRKDYQVVIEKMLPVEISKAAVRTLSAIALKGPLLQSKLVEIRGSSAYDHIKELFRNGLVAKRRQQQSFILKVTPKFHEYFKIQGSALSHILAQED